MRPEAVLSILVQAKGIEQTSRDLKNIDKTAQRTAGSTEKLEKRFSHLDNTVGDFNRSMTAMRNTVGLVKFPAMIAGAGMAAQAVGALGAATVSLGAAMAPLVGLTAAGASGYVALGQAVGTVKLATKGLEPAMKAATKAQDGTKQSATKLEGELKKLTPAQREFVGELIKGQKKVASLQETAAGGLLPGLTDALHSALPLFGRLKTVVGDTAGELGNLARRAGEVVSHWGPDLTAVGKTNVTVIHNMGRAAVSVATALKDIVVVGGPLLKWLTDMTAKGADWVRQQVHAGRESGKLADFLGKTRSVMSTLGRIAFNLGVGFWEIGKAAAPLGTVLLADIEKLTGKFKEWTTSIGGRRALADYFNSALEPIRAVAGLAGDLAGAFMRLSHPGEGTTKLAESLRPLVPVLEDLVTNTAAAFGPALIGALPNVVRLFSELAGTSGPLTVFVTAIGVLAGALADLLAQNPALNTALVYWLGFKGVWTVVSVLLGPLAAGLSLVAGALVSVTGAASGTALAITVLTSPITAVILALALLGGALFIAYKKSETFRDVVNGAFNTVKGTVTNVIGGIVTVVRGGFQVLKGLAEVFNGLLTLNFKQTWQGIKDIFSGSLTVILGIVKTYTAPFRAAIDAIGGGIKAGFKSAWDTVKGVFEDAINAVLGFLAKLAEVLNLIPGVPDIDTSGWHIGGGGGTPEKAPAHGGMGMARGGAFARTGGLVSSPITLMGEEAPRFPEYVIPTNPAYRGRAKGLLGQAASAIGFAQGGVSQYNHAYPRHIGPNPKFETFSPDVVAAIASSQGLPGTTFAQIARGESGYQPGVQQRDPGDGMVGYGLWQNTPNAWGGGAAFQYFKRIGGIPAMFNPVTNALMAKFLYTAAGNSISPWHGTQFVGGSSAGQPSNPSQNAGPSLPSVADIVGKFPNPGDLPEMFKGVGKYVIGKAKSYVKKAIGGLFEKSQGAFGPGGRVGTTKGPGGVGSFMGVPMANWVIESLKYAQSKGVAVRPTSGYRPGFDPHTASGRSEHQGTQYPHGAVDFGGYNTGGDMKRAVVAATAGFKYPLLSPIGFHDEGHASGTGHARGGVFKYLGGFAKGGITGSDGMAFLHKNEAVIPMAGGGKIGSYKSPYAGLTVNIGAGKYVTVAEYAQMLQRGFDPSNTDRSFGPTMGVGGVQPTPPTNEETKALEENTAAQDEANRLQEEANRLQERRIALEQLLADNQLKILAMRGQGDQILAAVVAAVNGGIGGKVGLGFQSPSYSGGMARYR